ncbi:hypothetical protein HELRODRAFT_165090 [Helobdella robusta]|uniref:Uncharacterized protein n=1 Tax=Helobdella robusta TaxID=6412 RepID=T1EWA1_HELRO|nr:hypothetical protein HELRODRAFT_165090 [Helobdella robusta]ESN92948.1 hypothetical protein HELRODRAFT_165090 [Helobdella robusta]
MASYSTAEALRLITQEDTESDEGNVTENDASSEDGDYLLRLGADSDTEDHVSEESDESEDVITSDEEPVNQPSTTVTKRGKGTASEKRGGRSRSFRGRNTHGTSDSAKPTAVGQSVVSINTIVDRTGRPNHLQSTDGKFRT